VATKFEYVAEFLNTPEEKVKAPTKYQLQTVVFCLINPNGKPTVLFIADPAVIAPF
jgi:hypothetical protein